MKVLIVIVGLFLVNSLADDVYSGPPIKPTVGGIWPQPKFIQSNKDYLRIDPNNFIFVVVNYSCDILQNALQRYKKITKQSLNSLIRKEKNQGIEESWTITKFFIKLKARIFDWPYTLTKFFVNLTARCEKMPYFGMDEGYSIETKSGRITADSIWGILRALETLSQLITPDSNKMLWIRDMNIKDSPHFSHRGLLLDTARHYISISTIYKILDGMAYNKLNVFHWHIVDDQSFPYQSINYPELSDKGAYMPSWIYTQKNISDIIEYARLRGIRIVAEFDVPGHTRSLGNSHPEILTKCGPFYRTELGPLNPIKTETYDFLEKFFSEVLEVFPDKYIHIGGDEVQFGCWESNEEIRNYVVATNLTYQHLQKIIMKRVSKLVTNKDVTPIVWQEAIGDLKLAKKTVIQVWTGDWRNLFNKFTRSGYRVILSECWYLDHLSTGGDWHTFYECDPLSFMGNDYQNRHVIGGEACMWGENINDYNVIQRIFPRVCAIAERLWYSKQIKNGLFERLEEHTCRMQNRGIQAQPPNGPGFC